MNVKTQTIISIIPDTRIKLGKKTSIKIQDILAEKILNHNKQ